MSQGAWVLVAVLLIATAAGVYRATRDGRFRGTRRLPAAVPTDAPVAEPSVLDGLAGTAPEAAALDGAGFAHQLGERATLLQFSSAFCAPCRATRRVLAEVSEVVPGVRHIEVDAEGQLDLVRRLGILRTPTTLILDREGREVTRATGAPSKDAVLASLARAVDVTE